jgi:hypothetical protein
MDVISMQYVIRAMTQPVDGHELTIRPQPARQRLRDCGQIGTAEVIADLAEDDEVERSLRDFAG